jgi:hypothetical protein
LKFLEGYGSQIDTTDIDRVDRDEFIGTDGNLPKTRGIAQAVGDYLIGVQHMVLKGMLMCIYYQLML